MCFFMRKRQNSLYRTQFLFALSRFSCQKQQKTFSKAPSASFFVHIFVLL